MAPKTSPSASDFESKPFEAFVNRTNPSKETLEVDSPVGVDNVQIPHPMLSNDAWIRAIPERGARVVTVSTAGGTLRRAVVGYYSRATAEYLTRYRQGQGLYKPLRPGEWDLMTPGVAYIHGTAEGKLHLRGGLIHGTLDPKKLKVSWRSPTHVRELHQKLDNAVVDEERFGVVIRHKTAQEKDRWLRAPGSETSFAKEYLRILGRDAKRLAAYLEGDLFNDTGKELKHTSTGRKLRALREYYTAEGETTWQLEVDDEKGATRWKGLADKIDVLQQAAEVTMSLLKVVQTISQSLNISAGSSIDISAATTGRYSGTQSTVLGPSPAPVDAVIKGTTFNATVMAPLLTQLSGFFTTAAGVFSALAVPPPAGPADHVAAKPLFASLAATLTAMSTAMGPPAAALPSTLSVNVKVSP